MAENKKSQKHGRNTAWCHAYKLEARREMNKARRLLRHLGRFTDPCARKALDRCKAALSVGQLRQLAKLEVRTGAAA